MSKNLMLVKITKADKKKWYAHLVGEVLCVRRKPENGSYEVFPTTLRMWGIRVKDCEEVFAVSKENFELLTAPYGKETGYPAFRMLAPHELKVAMSISSPMKVSEMERLRKQGNYAVSPQLIPLDGSVDQFAGHSNFELLDVSPPCAHQYIPEPKSQDGDASC